MLSFLPFISNEILAQDVGYDAYFRYESNPEQRVSYYPEGFGFDGMSPTAGYGFTFGNFGNGTNNNSLEFGGFDMDADEVPLGNGLLILGCLALMWFFLKTTRPQDYKRLIIRSYVETRQ